MFRWHSTSGRYASRCRDCEREVRQARRVRTRQNISIENRNRRFGVEIECIFPRGTNYSRVQSTLNQNGLSDWRVVGDGSLTGNGLEIVSPVLSGEDGMRQVVEVCRVLRDLGARINSSCGLHVHHEIRDLDIQAIGRFARAWANNQHVIDGLVSESRRGDATYCQEFTDEDASVIERAREITYQLNLPRYKAINFQSYPRFGTVEVRQHQGTLSATKIMTWIRFAQAMIATCAEEPTPVPRQETVRSFLRAFGERMDETARTFLLGRAVEIGHARVA